ncbi:hypothetical protein TR13x_05280 [Caloranaerobacter sp. TR13]|uniref:hypothetical protein n=1 Tax=Caloranaerobacter sp. TR13 TaxID=1302151 RepID=UPI0006D48654|nr:hypothetical protein [Caloranaerobacter sp. TR13]KPU27480.1 hypothetical protein TR13x_05280 [Caloranaerobacter sp. TR13]
MYNNEDIISVKLKLLKDMENSIIKAFKINFPNNIINPLIKTPITIENKKDNSTNIRNNYLQLVKTVLNKWKRAGLELTTYVYERHGYRWGKKIKDNYKIKSAEDIYRILKNYSLEESLNNSYTITLNDNNIVKFYVKKQILIDTWRKYKINHSIMYDLNRTWKEAFVNGLNPSFKLQATAENIDGTDVFMYTIFKK